MASAAGSTGYGKARFLRDDRVGRGKVRTLRRLAGSLAACSCCSSRSWPDQPRPRRSPSTRRATAPTQTLGMEPAGPLLRCPAAPCGPHCRRPTSTAVADIIEFDIRRREDDHPRHGPARHHEPRDHRRHDPAGLRGDCRSIQLVGPAGGATPGLTITGAASSGTVIRGLVIKRFTAGTGNAIRILNSSNNVIAGNFLGTNLAGTAASANDVGVYINGTGANGHREPDRRHRGRGPQRDLRQQRRRDPDRRRGRGQQLRAGQLCRPGPERDAALGNAGDGIAIFNGADDNTIGVRHSPLET